MIYEKKHILLVVCFCACMFTGCTSTKLHGYGKSTTDIRERIDELRDEQQKSSATGGAIEKESGELAELNADIAATITEGTGHYTTIKELIDQIRNGGNSVTE